jgi:REP element-mobilizing transposase RayT
MGNKDTPLLPDCTYHIFSRANGNERLFLKDENFIFFLNKFKLHILPIADIYAYNLLPNHFHFLIRIKSLNEIKSLFIKIKRNKPFDEELVPEFVMERFGNLLNSYTKSFNKYNQRRGGLFMDTMGRVQVVTDNDLASEIFYIHKNAVHHQYVSKIEDWRWSSYKSLVSVQPTLLLREEVLDFFGGKEPFIKFHRQAIYPKEKWLDDF